jgi:NitT/TauT family transport system substrate-binding protein
MQAMSVVSLPDLSPTGRIGPMMHRLTRLTAAAAMAALLATVAGCGSPAKSASGGPDKVTYLTAYGNAGRDAFAWVALKNGYFKKHHLNVTIQLGAAASKNLKLISAGQVDFASLDLVGAMIASATSGQRFQAIAAIHQKNLSSIISLPKDDITRPKDLEGKTVVTATGGVGKLLFPAYAKLAGIDPGRVKFLEIAPTQVAATVATGKARGRRRS